MPNDNDDSVYQSEDDALEPADDIYNPKRDEETLAQDYDTPASPPDDVHDSLPPDHPEKDSNMDSDEIYDEGETGATEADAQEELPRQEAFPLEPEDEDEADGRVNN
jgi:hypothetical protein